MSRGSTNSASTTFLRVSDGKIVETVKSDHPMAIKRINKKGVEVYERIDGYVEGVITSMHQRVSEHNGEETKELCLRMQSGGETYQLSLKEGSRYWFAFTVRLPNLDLTKPVRFSPYCFDDRDTGKTVIGMNLFQGDQKVQPRFTKENPGKMPQGKEVMFQGKPKWDFYERDQFLLTVIQYYMSKMQAAEEATSGETEQPATSSAAYQPQPPIQQSGRGSTPQPQYQTQTGVAPSLRQPLPQNPAAGQVYQGAPSQGFDNDGSEAPF